jgi:hypothetical protein
MSVSGLPMHIHIALIILSFKLHACISPPHGCHPVLLSHNYAVPIASCIVYTTGQGELSSLDLKIDFAIAVYLTPVSSSVVV